MTKLQIMFKIADYRREYEQYDMEYFICKYHAERLPKWVLEELLKRCNDRHHIVMLNDCVYSYWHDTYVKDFIYEVKNKRGFLFDSLEWFVCDSHGVLEVIHD